MSNLAGQLDADPEGPREEHLFACLDTLGITSEAFLDVQLSTAPRLEQAQQDTNVLSAQPERVCLEPLDPSFPHDVSDPDFDDPDVSYQQLLEQANERVELLDKQTHLSETETSVSSTEQVNIQPTLQGVCNLSQHDLRILGTERVSQFTIGMTGAVVAETMSPSSDTNLDISPLVSPNRRKLRNDALGNIVKQAKRMKRMATLQSAHDLLTIGTVVRIAAADVDRARGDPPTILTVVVEVTQKGLYRVANSKGVITPCLYRADLMVVEETSPENHGLEGFLASWHQMPKITIPKAVRLVSKFGGQGFTKCSCKGSCDSGRCTCKKKGIMCGSRCHNALQCCNK
jgi:hypothetical protein